jgi:hypothetical protein
MNFASPFRREDSGFVNMNGLIRHGAASRLGVVAGLLLSAVSLKADPIVIGEGPIFQPEIISKITLAILAEAACILWMLRRRRTPRWFILWLMGMHLPGPGIHLAGHYWFLRAIILLSPHFQ